LAILRGTDWILTKSVLAPVQLIRGIPSLYYRLMEKDMKWQARNSCRSNPIGHKIKLSWNVISRSLRHLKIISELNFIWSHIWSTCHFIFFMSWWTLASSRTKTFAKFVEDCLAKLCLETEAKKNLEISKFVFSMRGGAIAFHGVFNCCLWEIYAIKNFWRVTSLIFSQKSCKGKRCANF